MSSRTLILAVLIGLMTISCRSRQVIEEQSSQDPEAPKETWGWDYEGPRGPEHWAKINKQYGECASKKAQSPINLVWHKPTKNNPLTINYQEGTARLTNTGYTYRIEMTPQSRITFKGSEYILEKIEFRTPSEHTLSGNQLPMEMQFYHRSSNGLKQAIISMFVISGKPSNWFNEMWETATNLPKYKSSKDFKFNPAKLIPPRKTYYHYEGSLTHPPCLEGVQWLVFNTPLQLDSNQISTFRTMYNNNARPVQPTNERKITNY